MPGILYVDIDYYGDCMMVDDTPQARELLQEYKWRYNRKTGYACCKPAPFLRIPFHQLLLGRHCRHVNGNFLDNRRANLI